MTNSGSPPNDSATDRSIDDPINEALRAVRDQLDFEVAFISEFSSGQRCFRYVDSSPDFAPCHVGDSDALENSLCSMVADGRLPELLPDASSDPVALEVEATRSLPVGAHISVPIRIDGELFGTFCCFSREGDAALDERDLGVVRGYARLAERLLSRAIRARRGQELRRRQIRDVLEQRRFAPVFQPIFRLAPLELVGYEALTRFVAEPPRPADQWFNEAAAIGLHVELEIAALRRALDEFGRLPTDSYLSLNLSPKTIVDEGLRDALDGVPLDRVVLELTEHTSTGDYGGIAARLRDLRARGLRLAVDDAGAGYSSLRHFLRLEPEIIKLDASLVAAIDRSAKLRAMTTAMLAFARETGSVVVAEGVEHEQELQTLRELGVVFAQGYLLGRPAPLPDVT